MADKKKAVSPGERLKKRINREFKKCKFVGDISITDEEYGILLELMKREFKLLANSYTHEKVSTVLVTGLVQIGIRFYDGGYWPYVSQELGMKIGQSQRLWLSKSIHKTLMKHNKYTLGENETVNTILMHCFVTNHYADDFFEFLFAYYQIDLDRDLQNNTAKMKKYLAESIKNGENSSRAYRIKRHTADAVTANERGCKIRIARILRFIDNALFDDILPVNSRNRLAQLFVKWAETSKHFDSVKREIYGNSERRQRRFNTPYLHFDITRQQMELILPSQHANIDILNHPNLTWKIVSSNELFERNLAVNYVECVTGCKTDADKLVLPKDASLWGFTIELCSEDEERIHRFKIKEEVVRFFDSNWHLVTYKDYLPSGSLYAFAMKKDFLHVETDSVVDSETVLGMKLYTLNLKKGDVVKLPDGHACSVGKPLAEGILSRNKVPGSYVIHEKAKYDLYNSTPSIYFRMTTKQEHGTLIYVNGEKYRLTESKFMQFELGDVTEEKGYIINLKDFAPKNGVYHVRIDIPNSRKEREYKYALIGGFDFSYNGLPYIFKSEGMIQFPSRIQIYDAETRKRVSNEGHVFNIEAGKNYLHFIVKTGSQKMALRIYLPVFQWKFDNGEWHVDKPEDLWHKEFPSTIYFIAPDDKVTFTMSPLMAENDDLNDDEEDFIAVFYKDKEHHVFKCDTRKMLSWFGREEVKRDLYVEFENTEKFRFASIIARCFVGSCSVEELQKTGELLFKTPIAGFSDCVADLYLNNKLIEEKVTITSKGIRIKNRYGSGKYKIDFYEWEDDDDDFGFADYHKFATKEVRYENKNDLSKKMIIATEAAEIRSKYATFAPDKYALNPSLKIIDITPDFENRNVYYGKSHLSGADYADIKVRIEFLSDKKNRALLSFYDSEEETYVDFLYDRAFGKLALKENPNLNIEQARRRYIYLDGTEYCFTVEIK